MSRLIVVSVFLFFSMAYANNQKVIQGLDLHCVNILEAGTIARLIQLRPYLNLKSLESRLRIRQIYKLGPKIKAYVIDEEYSELVRLEGKRPREVADRLATRPHLLILNEYNFSILFHETLSAGTEILDVSATENLGRLGVVLQDTASLYQDAQLKTNSAHLETVHVLRVYKNPISSFPMEPKMAANPNGIPSGVYLTQEKSRLSPLLSDLNFWRYEVTLPNIRQMKWISSSELIAATQQRGGLNSERIITYDLGTMSEVMRYHRQSQSDYFLRDVRFFSSKSGRYVAVVDLYKDEQYNIPESLALILVDLKAEAEAPLSVLLLDRDVLLGLRSAGMLAAGFENISFRLVEDRGNRLNVIAETESPKRSFELTSKIYEGIFTKTGSKDRE